MEPLNAAQSSIPNLKKFALDLRALLRQSIGANLLADDGQFNRLALALFAWQREAVPIYGQFCEQRKVRPDAIGHWSQIPALPTGAFREFEVSSLPPGERTRVFESSGTTSQAPSRHFHHAQSLAVYEASLLPWFERHFFGAQSPPMKLVFLTPEEAPHSSLVHMFKTVRRHCGTPDSVFTGWLQPDGSWGLNIEQTLAIVREAIGANQPIGLLGTAFSFVHLLDALQAGEKSFALPKGSRVMETGGYKGRSREVPKARLRAMITRLLGVPDPNIVAEYGMSELSSQAYDRVAADELQPSGFFAFPPWARARIISVETGAEVESGRRGLLRVFDLANIWSVMAVQTEDLAVGYPHGFDLLGRAERAAPRGCSLLPGP
jgi:hypothetical protein